ncbi:MAG: response regulator [Clostridiales bacterium]|jgi:putative two-component system response regulator|nr:response regulator [Clostridiales bacterium]
MSLETGRRPKVLVVDDIETNRIILEEILHDYYEIEEASDGIEAMSKMLNSIVKPNLLLLDIMMPGMDGFEVLMLMKNDPVLKKIPVIFITAADSETQGLQAGAVDYISKPFLPEIVRLRVANHLELSLYRDKLEMMVEEKAQELIQTKENFLESIANMIEYRSLESGQHVKRTRELARIMVTQLLKQGRYTQDLVSRNYNALVKAVPLHDVGKIGIPDNILLKPGKLTPDEFDVIKTHTTIGGTIIKSLMSNNEEDDYVRHCYDICRSHHERWDGSGYPDGTANLDIPLSARIVAVVDVYDALVTERCYKKAFTHEETLDIMGKSSGSHLDPLLFETMMEVKDQFKNYEHQDYTNNSPY